jgi:hypothetical protein
MDYNDFISAKHSTTQRVGFTADCSGYAMFPFQRAIVEWALSMGRCAVFADTGLGKTFMQLAWADQVCRQTGGDVLILAPLAVSKQTEREAIKFGIPNVRAVRSADEVQPGITIINYDSLHKIDPSRFIGVVLDESSILKNAVGRTRNLLVSTFAETPYRLACTATPAPNDYTELGNHSEFLGVMDSNVMRARWFINDLGNPMDPWRLKGHAIESFWRWIASWARCVGRPSDMGDYSDQGYDLPELRTVIHTIDVDLAEDRGDGMLFRVPNMSATSIHIEKRKTCDDRAAHAAGLIAGEPGEAWVAWCETNYEQDAFVAHVPDCIDVRGNMKADEKADKLVAFTDDGGVIVTKPKIAGMGLNWQHAARMVFIGGSYSYEAFYQAVRRCWRFGQTREVVAHVIMAKTEAAMWHAIQRKASDHEDMKEMMFKTSKQAAVSHSARGDYNPNHYASIPRWLNTK